MQNLTASAINNISRTVINESSQSLLPGRENGPADAYRHILLSAELTREYGEDMARLILEQHEWSGRLEGQSEQTELMDRKNNDIGIELGKSACTWGDVVEAARGVMDEAISIGQDGPSNLIETNPKGIEWLDQDFWSKNPKGDNGEELLPGNWNWWTNPFADKSSRWPSGPYPLPVDLQKLPDGNYSASQVDLTTNTCYRNARTPPPKDPLALDLDNDGIETIGVTATTQVLFDFDADGIKTGTGWVKSDDALLVLDKNANGTIDNGNELFGVDTVLVNGPNAGQTAANGFAALADLDSNHDDQFSNLDSQYANVQIWRDLNQDGISQTGELKTLTQAGIASISLTSTASNNNLGNGNIISAVGTYTKTNGQTGTTGTAVIDKAANLDLASNPFYRVFTDPIPLTAEAAKLPGMQGSGAVRDLKEAASLNAALITDVNALAGTTRSQMLAQVDTLIQHWADSASMQTSQEKAAAQGYALVFGVPGATSNELRVQEAANDSDWQKSA